MKPEAELCFLIIAEVNENRNEENAIPGRKSDMVLIVSKSICVIDRITSHPKIPIFLIPRTREYITLYGKRDFTDMIKLRIFR